MAAEISVWVGFAIPEVSYSSPRTSPLPMVLLAPLVELPALSPHSLWYCMLSFCGAAWPLLAACDAACCLCFPGSGGVWTAAAAYVTPGGVGGASVAALVVGVGSACVVAFLVVGIFEAKGTIFNFQYAIADSAISPLTMTGVHIHPQSQPYALHVVAPASVEVAHVSRGLRGHPCQSIHGPHKFFKAWLLLRFRFRITRVQLLALMRVSAPLPLSSGPFSFLLPASCSRWSGEWPCIAGWYDWPAFGVGVINSLIGWLSFDLCVGTRLKNRRYPTSRPSKCRQKRSSMSNIFPKK